MGELFSRLSIKTKLTLVIMLASGLLLTVVSGVLLVAEYYSKQASLKHEIDILARSFSEQLRRPLLLEKFDDADRLLASLRRQENIHACYLFDRDGIPVAQYLRQLRSGIVFSALRKDFSPTWNAQDSYSPKETLRLDLNYFSSLTPLYFEGRRIGSLYLLSDLNSFYVGFGSVAAGVFVSLTLMSLFSLALAARLQRPISAPLLRLTGLMNRISRQNDYSLRAEKETDDEIGILVDGFNEMLRQIQMHQRQLKRHQQHLEKTVAARTADLRAAVKDLKVARAEADSANEAKSDFLSRMTHELRTPLIGVLGMNELLSRTRLDEEQAMLVDTVQKSGEELLGLISDVLDFSKIEAGKLSLSLRETDLCQLIEGIVDLLSPRAYEKGLQLISDIPLKTVWKVKADDVRLRQILMNLIGNAIKFTSEGSVCVRLSMNDVSYGQADFKFEIEDTGCGMEPWLQQQIFAVFYQIDGTDTRQKQGAGLGLAIVRQLVDLMGGRIDLVSRPERGSLFSVTLTLPLIEKIDFSLPENLHRKKVLICDADWQHADILRRRLEDMTLQAAVVADAVEAIYRLRSAVRSEQPFDLVFIGEEMALPTGQPLYLAMREERWFPLRRILLCQDRGSNPALVAGETRFFKPSNWSRIQETVSRSWHQMKLVTHPRTSLEDAVEGRMALIVSPHVVSRELLKLALKKESFSSDTVSALPEATSLLEKKDYLVTFYDLGHLNEDGLVPFLKVSRHKCHLTVAISEQQVDQEKFSDTDAFLLKPVSHEALSQVLSGLPGSAGRDRSPGVIQ